MDDKMINTVTCCTKIKIPDSFEGHLNSLLERASLCVDSMLSDRKLSSSKYYPQIPSVIAKSLIAKYQKNKKCKVVSIELQVVNTDPVELEALSSEEEEEEAW